MTKPSNDQSAIENLCNLSNWLDEIIRESPKRDNLPAARVLKNLAHRNYEFPPTKSLTESENPLYDLRWGSENFRIAAELTVTLKMLDYAQSVYESTKAMLNIEDLTETVLREVISRAKSLPSSSNAVANITESAELEAYANLLEFCTSYTKVSLNPR